MTFYLRWVALVLLLKSPWVFFPLPFFFTLFFSVFIPLHVSIISLFGLSFFFLPLSFSLSLSLSLSLSPSPPLSLSVSFFPSLSLSVSLYLSVSLFISCTSFVSHMKLFLHFALRFTHTHHLLHSLAHKHSHAQWLPIFEDYKRILSRLSVRFHCSPLLQYFSRIVIFWHLQLAIAIDVD